MQDAAIPEPPLFIVILDEAIIARDIELTIRDLRPDANVLVARSLDEAAFILPDAFIEAAFVQTSADQILSSCLGKRVRQKVGRLILVGREPDEAGDGISVLPFPFSQANLAALLAGNFQQ